MIKNWIIAICNKPELILKFILKFISKLILIMGRLYPPY